MLRHGIAGHASMTVATEVTEIAAFHARGGHARLGWRGVAPAATVRPRPPLFMLGAWPPGLTRQVFAPAAVHEVGVWTLRDALVAPTGIAILDGIAFHADAFIHPAHHVIAVIDRLNAARLPVRHVPGPLAVIYGPAHETWGHWLADFLPRLWVLAQASHDLATLRFLAPPELRPFARELLGLVGIGHERIETYAYWRETVATDTLLMPTGLRAGDALSPCFAAATAWWTARLRAAAGLAPPAGGRRLYLSRDGAPQDRAMAERAAVEARAQLEGFDIVRPEGLGLAAQAALFGAAGRVLGEYGSALHSTVFSAPGTVACGLRGAWRHPGFLQTGIATALGQDSAYVLGEGAGTETAHAFRIAPEDLDLAFRLLA